MSPAGDRDFQQRLANLTPAQRAVLEQRLLQRRARESNGHAITRREGTGPAELSHAQEMLWLLSQVFDGGIAYNSPGAFHLEGPLDLDVLGQALTALTERHEILRTTYDVIGGRPMPCTPLAWPPPPVATVPAGHSAVTLVPVHSTTVTSFF